MNNIACVGISCTASCAGFFKGLNERWEGKPFAFFFSSLSVSSFVSLYLIIQLKYPENYHERLRTRQVYWIWKCNLVTFLGADFWTKDGGISLQCKYNNIRNFNISLISGIIIFLNKFSELRCFDTVFWRPYRYLSIPLKVTLSLSDRYKIFTSDWPELKFVKMQF